VNEVLKSTASTLDKEHKWKECVGHVLYPAILTDPNRLRTRAEEAAPRNKIIHSLFKKKVHSVTKNASFATMPPIFCFNLNSYDGLRIDFVCCSACAQQMSWLVCNVCFGDGVTTFQNITLFIKFKTVQNIF
jgi:hypothetical protein